MITYVNSSNSTKYSVLFADAEQALIAADIAAQADGQEKGSIMPYEEENGAPKRDEAGLYIPIEPITTIERYFAKLPELVQLGGADSDDEYEVLHSSGRRYTMLPIDEDVFDINANTRIISVPTSFVRNGIAVKGDELSEVLYFRIDRFFDAMDLDTANIYIQWTRPDGQSGVSKPWVIDIESEPNKIIFGWAISSSIAKMTGTLRFAVRFYKWADDQHETLNYSWATQAQTVSIKDTLDFALNEENFLKELTTDSAIVNRITGSKTHITDNEDAAAPEYVFNLRDNLVNDLPVGKQEDGFVYIDLVADPVTGKETYTFKVQAKSTDGGIVSYTWKEKDHSQPLGSDYDQGADGTKSITRLGFELTADTEVKDKIYYIKTGEGNQAVYTAFDTDGLEPEETPVSKGLYEKFAYCTVSQIGTYKAVASNRKVGSNATTLNSDTCIVPMPVDPTITTQIPAAEIIPEVDSEKNPITDGAVTLTVVATNTETNGSKDGVLTYSWFYKQKDTDGWVQLKGKTESSLEIVNNVHFTGITTVEGENGETIDAETGEPLTSEAEIPQLEGFYKVRINNHKNMQDTIVDSIPCRVSFTAEAPVITFPTDGSADSARIKNVGETLYVQLSENWYNNWNVSDDILFQWYKSGDVEGATTTEDNVAVEGATNRTFVPTEHGVYFCHITNIKNGTEASTDSATFSVN